MTIPTSGTYDGLYITETAALSASISSALSSVGLGNVTLISQVIGADTAVTFAPGTLSFTDTADTATILSDANVDAQGSNAFEITAGGTNYIVSNAPIVATVSLDQSLQALIDAGGPTGLAAVGVKATVDAAGFGGLLIIPGSTLAGGTYAPPCFARGTLIETPDGAVPVEALQVGSHVVLATGGTAAVIWLGHRRVRTTSQPSPELVYPIRITAGALGGGLPRRDLVVSPDHGLFVDGALVPAGLLVGGEGIRQERVDTVEYFHVELPVHAILLAEGAPAESYLDSGNRHTFSNASLVALHPDLSPAVAADRRGPCAEMVLEGPRLTAIRARRAEVSASTEIRAVDTGRAVARRGSGAPDRRVERSGASCRGRRVPFGRARSA